MVEIKVDETEGDREVIEDLNKTTKEPESEAIQGMISKMKKTLRSKWNYERND